MKTILTVALTIFNVVCGVNICSASSKPQQAATFYGSNSSAIVCESDVQQASKFYLLSSTANTTDIQEACEFNFVSDTANVTDEEVPTFIVNDRALDFLNSLVESSIDEK